MNTADALVKTIFQRERLDDCSLEELQSIAGQYPYFAPIQLLLAEKLKPGNQELYNEQLKKLSLRFNNPLWLDFLLNGYQTEPMSMPHNGSTDSMETLDSAEGQTQTTESPNPGEGLVSEIEISEPVREDWATAPDEPPGNTTNMVEIDNREASEEYSEQINSEIEGSTEINDIPVAESAALSENIVASEDEVVAGAQSDDVHVDSDPSIAKHPEQESAESPFSIPLSEPDSDSGQNNLAFEPYHTVDYFASQGIKFVPEEKPADRFGQQLKSFTEWLKAMKRLPQTETPKMSDPQSEEKVQQLASHSVTEADVSTEAMAEVWLEQGNKEKAIEIYHKLSLLNPAKSAYFASLAAQLKDR